MTEKFKNSVAEALADGNFEVADKKKLNKISQQEGIEEEISSKYIAEEILKKNSKIKGYNLLSFGITANLTNQSSIVELIIKIIDNLDKIKDFIEFFLDKVKKK